jgi:hypothetical protein
MKLIPLILLSIFFNTSCKCLKKDKVNCNLKVENMLKTFAIPLIQNKNTKVYTLDYSKLSGLTKDKWNAFSDSLYNFYFLPCDTNCVKHYLYYRQLQNLDKLDCNINIKDVQKHFGNESLAGTKNDEITTLFYYFNNKSNMDCFEDTKSLTKFNKCSAIIFSFDSNQVLKEIIVDDFSYF